MKAPGISSVLFGNYQQSGDLEQFLKSYREDPWLHVCVSRIAQAESSVTWHLNKVDNDGNREEVTDQKHELKMLLNHPNPMQTGNDLVELGSIYSLLTGKEYWRLSKEKGKNGLKWELNLIPSIWLQPVLNSAGVEIEYYHYERNGFKKDFPVEEIIPFVHSDPANPLDGVGPTHAIGMDLNIHSFARQFNRNFFYNDAEAGVIFKVEASDESEIDRMSEKYNSKHRGYGRAHKADFISGITEIIQSESKHKDMHFPELMEWERKVMFGAFGMPYTLAGGTDLVQRGNADAALYYFGKWVIVPRLEFRKRKLNEYLVPRFGEGLELDYDDPTPENREAMVKEAMDGWNGGLFTRNQALAIMNYDPVEGTEGEEYKQQTSSFSFPGFGEGNKPKEEEQKAVSDSKVKIFKTEAEAEEFWKAYVKQTETHEKAFITSIKTIFETQKGEALNNLKQAVDRNAQLVDVKAFIQQYEEKLTPVLSQAMLDAIKQGMELIALKNPHKADSVPSVLSKWATEWLKVRIAWAAAEVGEETESLLRQALITGFNAGESTDDIAKRVSQVFGDIADYRAQRIARTEIISASAQGSLTGYKESGVVDKVQYYTAMDERTCEYCNNYHDQIYAIGNEIPIPLHPNCRCVWLPVIE